jgi:FtsZ-interacting cell division protein ZipA
MTSNQVTLLFVGVILGAFTIIAIIFIAMGVYRQKKVEKAYRNNKDLAQAKRDYDNALSEYYQMRNQCQEIMNQIDNELSRKPYLTKVKAFEQEKELEKLRYQLEILEPKKQQKYDIQRECYVKWQELREKYKIAQY